MTSGQEVDQVDKRYRVPQDCPFQSALRIYSSPYVKGPFNAFEGTKRITNDGMVLWRLPEKGKKHDACLDAIGCLRLQMVFHRSSL
jgi:hypothetical protein